jgi:hypothetical protein
MEQWTLYGIIVLAVTILAAIAAILSVKQPSVRVLLLSILGVVGLLAIGAIVLSRSILQTRRILVLST